METENARLERIEGGIKQLTAEVRRLDEDGRRRDEEARRRDERILDELRGIRVEMETKYVKIIQFSLSTSIILSIIVGGAAGVLAAIVMGTGG